MRQRMVPTGDTVRQLQMVRGPTAGNPQYVAHDAHLADEICIKAILPFVTTPARVAATVFA